MALQEHRTAVARPLPGPAAGVPRPGTPSVAHAVLPVSDLPAAAAWFARAAGLRICAVDARRIVLGEPETATPLLSLVRGGRRHLLDGVRLTLCVGDRGAWLHAVSAASAAGAELVRVHDRAVGLDGPDGLEVRLAVGGSGQAAIEGFVTRGQAAPVRG